MELKDVLNGWTAPEIARWADCDENTVYRWKSGHDTSTKHLRNVMACGETPLELKHRLAVWFVGPCASELAIEVVDPEEDMHLDLNRDGRFDHQDIAEQASLLTQVTATQGHQVIRGAMDGQWSMDDRLKALDGAVYTKRHGGRLSRLVQLVTPSKQAHRKGA